MPSLFRHTRRLPTRSPRRKLTVGRPAALGHRCLGRDPAVDNREVPSWIRTLRVMTGDLYVDSAGLGRVQATLADSSALLSAPRAALRSSDRGAVGQRAVERALGDFLDGWEHGFDLIEDFATSAARFLRDVDDVFVAMESALTGLCRPQS